MAFAIVFEDLDVEDIPKEQREQAIVSAKNEIDGEIGWVYFGDIESYK